MPIVSIVLDIQCTVTVKKGMEMFLSVDIAVIVI
jgi:hypothetical protein